MMEDNRETFRYTYSAKEQEELKNIRQKYLPKEQDKMEQLRRLDQSATKRGTIIALIVGIISSLLLGIGMSCTMVWANTMFIPGIIIGIIGIAGVSAAYPLYKQITKKQRGKLAPEIIRLTEELIK